MKHLSFLLALLMLIASCGSAPIDNPTHKKYSLEQFLDTTTYTGGSFSFDEKRILFSSNATGIFNAYSMSIGGGKKKNKETQLTNSTDHSIYALSFFPNDDRILYYEDGNGNELTHIYLREGNGSVRDLTPIPEARAEYYGWTHGKESFLYGSNARDPRFMDVYEMNIETFEPKLLFKNDEGFIFRCISPNKRFIALAKIVSTTRSDMYLYDIEQGTLTHMTQQETDAENDPQTFSLDSNTLYFLTNEANDFTYVKKTDLVSGKTEAVYQQPWDITSFSFSHKGTYYTVTVNEDAKQKAKIFHADTNKPLKLPKNLDKDIVKATVSKSEALILFSVNSDTTPTNLYIYNIEKGTHRKLTDSLSPGMDPAYLVEAQVVRYPAADGLLIPALYYQPKNASPDNKVAALIWVHGGPGGQSTRTYNYMIQYLVSQGYAILAVNNRGSSGYGKAFYALADRKHGDVDLQDCLAGKKFLAATGVVDPDRIGIIGGSYGGYITLAALAFHPEEMAIGIDLFGVANWPRTLTSIPSWWEKQRQMMHQKIGHPEDDHDYLVSISPLFHAANIKKPLMVLQGANDPRVLKIESDEIIAEAEKSGIPYRYIIFGDEGHGFTKDRNRLHAGKAVIQFLKSHL